MIILKDYIMCQINIRKEIKAIEDNTILAGKIVRKTVKTTILFFRPRDYKIWTGGGEGYYERGSQQ